MKKILLSLIFFLVTVQTALATPVIQNVSVEPPYLWLGESASISLNCFDSENNTINQVYANIVGPSIILPTMNFTESGEKYLLTVSNIYLDRTGRFDATIICKNNNSQANDTLTNFTISQLTGYIASVKPGPAYIGDVIEIDFIVKKDNANLTSGVSFDVTLNGELKPLKAAPAYDTSKGWILKIDSPSNNDTYDLNVIAFYDRSNVSDSDTLTVKEYIEFGIASIDKNWINPNDEVIVTLRALQKGSIINLNKDILDIQIGSTEAEIKDIVQRNDLFDVNIVAPNLLSGKYQLKATLNYEGSHSDSKDLSYIVPITGKIVGADSKGMSVQIRFIKNGVAKLTLLTDAFGSYSGSLPPDTYDVSIIFPQSKLYLYDAAISNFNDPIKYFFSIDTSVSGIRSAGLHDFGVALSYSTASIEMEYDERNVEDERDLKIFKCSNWNTGRKACNSGWAEVVGNIDVVRNLASVNSSTLSAFVIGTIEALKADFSFDKEKYNLGDTVKIRGILKDDVGNLVGNASVTVKIKETGSVSTATTDKNGVFSISLTVPEIEEDYTLVLTAKKYPFRDLTVENTFKVVKSKSVYINFPDTVKIGRGENYSQQFSLVNTGQADLELILSLEGISKNYFGQIPVVGKLKAGEEKSFYINFNIPIFADLGIASATLRTTDGDMIQDKVFGLNIVERSQNVTAPATGFASRVVFPEFNLDVINVILLVSIFAVMLLILNKKLRKKRDAIKSFLFDVKSHLKKAIVKAKPTVSIYDSLISSEFPNALRKLKDDKKWSE